MGLCASDLLHCVVCEGGGETSMSVKVCMSGTVCKCLH